MNIVSLLIIMVSMTMANAEPISLMNCRKGPEPGFFHGGSFWVVKSEDPAKIIGYKRDEGGAGLLGPAEPFKLSFSRVKSKNGKCNLQVTAIKLGGNHAASIKKLVDSGDRRNGRPIFTIPGENFSCSVSPTFAQNQCSAKVVAENGFSFHDVANEVLNEEGAQ